MTTTDEPIYQVESLIAEDIDAYLDAHQHKTMLRFITCGSVDDGKSTLIGRMLYDSHMIFEDHLQALESDSKRVGTQGEAIDFAHGSFGGWEPFGPARKVTRCDGNVLFELDGEPALDIYKRYLGDHAKGLPASGLLFPFAMVGEDRNAVGLIRTILGIDEAAGSLVLAGEIYQDGYLQLMHASTDALVEGATQAAEQARAGIADASNEGLAVLVSCVGRKLAMAGRVDEEVEAVSDTLGRSFAVTGFYSNGEISPDHAGPECHLHNQTMTITLITEELSEQVRGLRPPAPKSGQR